MNKPKNVKKTIFEIFNNLEQKVVHTIEDLAHTDLRSKIKELEKRLKTDSSLQSAVHRVLTTEEALFQNVNDFKKYFKKLDEKSQKATLAHIKVLASFSDAVSKKAAKAVKNKLEDFDQAKKEFTFTEAGRIVGATRANVSSWYKESKHGLNRKDAKNVTRKELESLIKQVKK